MLRFMVSVAPPRSALNTNKRSPCEAQRRRVEPQAGIPGSMRRRHRGIRTPFRTSRSNSVRRSGPVGCPSAASRLRFFLPRECRSALPCCSLLVLLGGSLRPRCPPTLAVGSKTPTPAILAPPHGTQGWWRRDTGAFQSRHTSRSWFGTPPRFASGESASGRSLPQVRLWRFEPRARPPTRHRRNRQGQTKGPTAGSRQRRTFRRTSG